MNTDCSEIFKFFVIVATATLSLTAGLLVNLTDYWVAHTLQLFKVFFKVVFLGVLIRVQPVLGFGEGVADLTLVVSVELVS